MDLLLQILGTIMYIALPILTFLGLFIFLYIGIRAILYKTTKREAEEVDSAIAKTLENIKSSETVIDLMIQNVAELKGYYVISKQQANRSFMSALTICFLGFTLFASGIVISFFSNENILIYTTVAGSIVEIVSGLFFWLYKSSTKQLNIYHERLGATEKYLTAIQLVDKMDNSTKDDAYRFLIESLVRHNSPIENSNNEKRD